MHFNFTYLQACVGFGPEEGARARNAELEVVWCLRIALPTGSGKELADGRLCNPVSDLFAD